MKKIILTVIGSAFLLLGGNAMADTLTTKQQTITEVAAYTALGNQDGLKKALIKGLDNGVRR